MDDESASCERVSRNNDLHDVRINVYDLLPASGLTSLLWMVGSALLHSGVVVDGKEYAFGGHGKKGVSGIYWTKPGLEPPGARFKCQILQGVTTKSSEEIDEIVKEVSHMFLGPSWNLLTNNCNHFTSYLCRRLTKSTPPSWLNRAASIGIALPCVVPREWVNAPDAETANGDLVAEEDEGQDERRGFLQDSDRTTHDQGHYDYALRDTNTGEDVEEPDWWEHEEDEVSRGAEQPSSFIAFTDSSGRNMPVGERAPVPRG